MHLRSVGSGHAVEHNYGEDDRKPLTRIFFELWGSNGETKGDNEGAFRHYADLVAGGAARGLRYGAALGASS